MRTYLSVAVGVANVNAQRINNENFQVVGPDPISDCIVHMLVGETISNERLIPLAPVGSTGGGLDATRSGATRLWPRQSALSRPTTRSPTDNCVAPSYCVTGCRGISLSNDYQSCVGFGDGGLEFVEVPCEYLQRVNGSHLVVSDDHDLVALSIEPVD